MMNAQLNSHAVQETATVPFAPQPILPVVIEQTARHVFESFSEKMKAALNGREERALKLALEGHVTHKSARIYSVRSENGQHAYLVNLDKSFCTCPDSSKGYVCKHRLAAYLVEQAQQAHQQLVEKEVTSALPTPPPPSPDPDEEAIERARLALHARSQFLREAIIYALLPQDGELIPVELLTLEGEAAMVRALPTLKDGKLIPQFPFSDRKSVCQVIAKSLVDVKIYR